METVPLSADYSANIWCNVSKHTFGSLLNLLWCTQLLNLGTHMSVRRENKLNPSAALLTDRYYWITTNHYPRGYVYTSELLNTVSRWLLRYRKIRCGQFLRKILTLEFFLLFGKWNLSKYSSEIFINFCVTDVHILWGLNVR